MKRLDLIFFEFFSNIERLALLLENIQDKYRLCECVQLTFYEFNLLGGLSNSKVLNLES